MKGVVVQTVAEHLRVNVGAALLRVLQLFDHERRRAFSHDESIALEIERPAGQRRIAGPLAHRFDDGKGAKGERAERRFRAAGDDDIGEIVADVAKRFADRDRAAGATVRVRRSDAAKSELDGDVRMGRAAEDLQREGLVHAARSLFQEMRVLIFRIRDAAERRAETDADPMLRRSRCE